MMRTMDLVFPADDPAFDGHFPGNPVVPGALLLDQALALVCTRGLAPVREIQRVKFLRALTPDTPCRITVRERDAGTYELECRIDGAILLTAIVRTDVEAQANACGDSKGLS